MAKGKSQETFGDRTRLTELGVLGKSEGVEVVEDKGTYVGYNREMKVTRIHTLEGRISHET